MNSTEIKQRLFLLQDKGYKQFQSGLMPTVDSERVIGVRTPELRAFAKELLKQGDYEDFLSELPHRYYEEDNLHALLIMGIKDYDRCIMELERFLPFIDNWATCDMLRPKVLRKEPDRLVDFAFSLLDSSKTYSVRYGIGLLLSYCLDESFSAEQPERVSLIKSEEYYINMMIAWYFATALAKQYESAVSYLENKCLSPWVHNKTIQKAIESYRIPDDTKKYLKQLKIR